MTTTRNRWTRGRSHIDWRPQHLLDQATDTVAYVGDVRVLDMDARRSPQPTNTSAAVFMRRMAPLSK